MAQFGRKHNGRCPPRLNRHGGSQCLRGRAEALRPRRGKGFCTTEARDWGNLADRDETFRLAFEHARDAIFWADPQTGTILNCNRAAELLIKLPREEMIGKHQSFLHPPEETETYVGMFREHLQGRAGDDRRAQIVDATGHRRTVQITGSIAVVAGRPLLQGIFHDITEKDRAERALRLSENRYRALVENIDLPVALIDSSYRIVKANAAAGRLFGKPPEKLVGRPCHEEFQKRPEPCKSCPGQAALRLGVPAKDGAEMIRDDGSRFEALLRAFPVRDDKGAVTGFTEIIEDVTQRRRIERSQRVQRDLGIALATATELDDVLQRILDAALQIPGVDGGAVYLVSPEGDAVEMRHYRNIPPDIVEAVGRVDMSDPVARLINVDEPTYGPLPEMVADTSLAGLVIGMASAAVLPIRHEGRIVATLNVLSRSERHLSGLSRSALEAIAYQVGGVIQRIRAEKQLRASETRWRTLFQSVPLAVSIARPGGPILAFNDKALALTGYSAEEFGKLRPSDIHPEDGQRRDLVTRLQRDGQVQGVELTFHRKDGSTFPTSCTFAVIDWQGEPAILAIGEDITKRKHAEQELRESEQRYRALVEAAPHGIDETDLQGRITFANRAHYEMFGYEEGELLGMHIWDRLPSKTERRRVEALYRLIRAEQPEPGPFVTQKLDADGNLHEIQVDWNYRRNVLGEVTGYIAMITDITARVEAENALRAAHRELMNAREDERKYLASELHDSIGQGLVALQLGIQDAVDQSRDKISPDQVFALARATAHCGELIREVRQICHGLYPPTLESLGLCSALAQLANHCESAGLTVETECTPALHTLRLLPDHEIALFRIAQEAVNNVIRHSQATEVMLSMAIAGDEVVLKVIDNGVGFDTRAKGRWGLGLNTMRDRAEAVGGQLDLASEPGRTEVAAAIPLMLRDDET